MNPLEFFAEVGKKLPTPLKIVLIFITVIDLLFVDPLPFIDEALLLSMSYGAITTM